MATINIRRGKKVFRIRCNGMKAQKRKRKVRITTRKKQQH